MIMITLQPLSPTFNHASTIMRLHSIDYFLFLVISSLTFLSSSSFVLPSSSCGVPLVHKKQRLDQPIGLSSTNNSNNDKSLSNNNTYIYFDLTVLDEPAGRLVFQIPQPNRLPRHTENLLKLISKAQTSIDPRCSYIGCPFAFSPQFVEGYPQYKWAHMLRGKGKNAVGRVDELVREVDGTLQQCTHSIYGGSYYGLNYDTDIGLSSDDNDDDDANNEIVLLTVPLSGPGRGSTGLSVVRVSESPQEWQERLLINSAVLGWMEGEASFDTLYRIARQTDGPPVVVDTGIMELED